MQRRISCAIAMALCVLGLQANDACAAATTGPAKELRGTDFLRFVDRGSSGSRLETADVAFRNADGATVHLVAAVHIGDKDYYQALSESFKLREAVLYEMVKPRGVDAPRKGQTSQSGVAQFQRLLKDVLELNYQLDDIDYTAENFVHADLDSETFEKKQAERGESFEMMMLQALMRAMSQASTQPSVEPNMDETLQDLVKLITRPDPHRQMKLIVANSMANIEESAMGLDGPGGSVILTERNKAAMEVLDRTLASGKKDIAVFYGAAHMPDLAKRLAERGFKPLATQWHIAWDLTIRDDQPSAIEKALLDAFRELHSSSD